MKQILLFAFMLSCLWACDDDFGGFNVPTEFRNILFEPTEGGAIMRYYLPSDMDIFGVRVRYTNAWGEEQMRDGSYLVDSLLLDGFTEARQNVPARVSFFNRFMEESEPVEMTFNTEKSATVAVFDNLTVNTFWGGFNVTYNAPQNVNGLIHVFYMGTNPLTLQPDTILMASVPIVEGGDTLNFVMQQAMDSVDVVVRTDNYKGYRVKQEIFRGLPCLSMDTLTPSEFDFKFMGEIVDNDENQFGMDYLFDGDKKGWEFRKNSLSGERYKYSTFVAGPYAFEKRFIIDLREERIPAAVNLYAFLFFNTSYPYNLAAQPLASEVWSGYYSSRLPSSITLYGTNENPETVDLNACVRLFSLDDDPDYTAGFLNSWAVHTDRLTDANWELWDGGNALTASDEDVEAADPVVLNMLCNYSGEAYRYLIFVVHDTYDSYRWLGQEENPREYVTINELEVCIKAE